MSVDSEAGQAASALQQPDTSDPSFRPVKLQGRWTRLRPVIPSDIDWLYALSTGEETGFRWRFRGETPNPQAFASLLWDSVLVQFVAETLDPPRPMGLLVAYAADDRNGHARFGAIFNPAFQKLGWPLEACGLFLNYLFNLFPLRKIYLEGSDFNVELYARGLNRLLVEEGRLRGHTYIAGSYSDYVMFALYREAWEESAAPILERLG